jgi:hypothetical protein
MSLLLPNGPFYTASSAQINVSNMQAISSNVINSSGTLNSSSAVIIASQLAQASSCILGIMTQSQQGYQVSS